MIRADVHLHSRDSRKVVHENCVTSRYNILDSYADPEQQYKIAMDSGMDLFVLTDHNSIDEAKMLADKYDNCIVGCEYYVECANKDYQRPTAQDHEVLVLDVDDYFHKEAMRARLHGVREFSRLVKEKPHSLAHPGWAVNAKAHPIKMSELEEWVSSYDVIEGLNGDLIRANELAHMASLYWKKPMSGGSDDHAYVQTALAYTVAPDANSKGEFLQHFREGRIYPEGSNGCLVNAQRTMINIGRGFLDSEKERRKEMGFFRYFSEDLSRLLMLVAPLLIPAYLRVAAIRNKVAYERLGYELEERFIDYIKSQKDARLKAAVSELERGLQDEIDGISAMMKPRSGYIPKLCFLDRIFSFLLGGSKAVRSDFENT